MKLKMTPLLLTINAILLVFILLLLVFKEPISVTTEPAQESYVPNSSYEVAQLSENIIAIVSTDYYSADFGELIALEFDPDTDTFNVISNFDIRENWIPN